MNEQGHVDPFSFVLLELGFFFVVGGVGRWLATLGRQPAVLGELLIGVAVGNVGYWLGVPIFRLFMHFGDAQAVVLAVWSSGVSVAEAARRVLPESAFGAGGAGELLTALLTGPGAGTLVAAGVALWFFASLGVILLLFLVGLETDLDEMRRLGARAALVGTIGVVTPLGLGLAVTPWLAPGLTLPGHLFLAATLCATSVGITARVFRDLGRLDTTEARIILGAAIIDDVLGLIVLAVVAGVAATGHVHLAEVGRIALLATLFLAVVAVFGERLVRLGVRAFEWLDPRRAHLLFPLVLAFGLAWLANLLGLATIIGAFAAGLILKDEFFETTEREATMERLIGPVEAIFAPLFFVLMGMQVNLAAFARPATLLLAAALTVVAVSVKVLAGLGAGRGVDRLSVGIGMVPRGEVGLIFAGVGRGLGVIDDGVFAALVIVLMVTTVVTPIGLRWSLDRAARRGPAASPGRPPGQAAGGTSSARR